MSALRTSGRDPAYFLPFLAGVIRVGRKLKEIARRPCHVKCFKGTSSCLCTHELGQLQFKNKCLA